MLVAPKFFGYAGRVDAAIRGKCDRVISVDDRLGNDLFSKALIRFGPRFITQTLSRWHYRHQLKNLSPCDVEIFFFINPELIDVKTLLRLKEKFVKARFLAYFWDSFKNKKNNISYLAIFDRVYTFDRLDARRYFINYLPLFHDISPKYQDYKESDDTHRYDISMIGSDHSDRYRVCRSLSVRHPNSFFRLVTKGAAFNFFLAIWERDFTRLFSELISHDKYAPSDVEQISFASRAVLDIHHPSQDGLTMRTIEVLCAGCKLVTTNTEIVNTDLYHPSRVLCIDRTKPSIPASFLETPVVPLSQEVIRRYHISSWVDSVLA